MGNAPTCCCNSDSRGAAVPPEEHVAKAMVMAARNEASDYGGSVPTLQTPHGVCGQPVRERGPEPAEPEGEEAADKNNAVGAISAKEASDTDAPLVVPPPVVESHAEVTTQDASDAVAESAAKEEWPTQAGGDNGSGHTETPVERIWEVELRRTPTESSLGVSLYVSPSHLVIHGISAGMVRTFNQSYPAMEVKRGTVIIEVNGRADSSQAMFNALRSESVLRVKLKRVPKATLFIEKDGPLGVDVSPSSMEVKMVKEGGAVELYNRGCKAGYQMSPGDVITEVNGITGDVKAMLREIASSAGSMKISIQRD